MSLASRNLKNITRQFPSIADAAARLRAQSAVVNGEIVALDADGRPSFQALHHWTVESFCDREVFVFRDLEGRVKVLHRKRDGRMELIEAP